VAPARGSPLEVLGVALRLGLTSFGGPVAHIGYFRSEYVARRGWVDEATFADLVALCQFLPGPASSKVGIGLGILRAGLLGGLCAWLGFTLPSALALTLFAFGVGALGGADAGLLHGLKVVAVAVVAQAVWAMARSLAPDRERATVALAAAVATLAWPSALGQVVTIALAALIGWRLLPRDGAVSPGSGQGARPGPGRGPPQAAPPRSAGRPDGVGRRSADAATALGPSPSPLAEAHTNPIPVHTALVPFGRRTALVAWGLFFGLLIGLPLLRAAVPGQAIALLDTFYRVGALVFGGGHVILPLLQAEVVPPGWVTREQFVAGYGAAQAVPGPLFTFSAYLGAVMSPAPNGWTGAGLALVAIFVPSFLLVVGSLPFWDELRSRPAFRDALRGVNAAVVGLLLAALYQPVWTSAILGPTDFALALAALGLLAFWKLPPWLVVLLAAAAGALLGLL
jgi:chromate transporter